MPYAMGPEFGRFQRPVGTRRAATLWKRFEIFDEFADDRQILYGRSRKPSRWFLRALARREECRRARRATVGVHPEHKAKPRDRRDVTNPRGRR